MRWKFWLPLFLAAMVGGAARSAEYTLGPGDVVHITVYEHDDLTTEDRITEAGAITFPLLGAVRITGMTKSEAEQFLQKQLTAGNYINNPNVTLRVVQYRSKQVSVIGMVGRPGMYNIERSSSLLEILAQAGGIAPDGDDKVTILRTEDGHTLKVEVDTKKLFQQGELDDNIDVASGDVLYVPRAPMFYVYGEVQRPGAYRLQRDMTVLQALSVGGGITPRGTERGISIKRRDPSGSLQNMTVKMTEVLQPDDVITVKERLF